MKILVTGGAGFIGSNIARSMLEDGHEVVVFDNLSRPGVRKNLEWLEMLDPVVMIADTRDINSVKKAMKDIDVVFHYAGQVGVQTSIDNPIEDFDINVRGTLNILEVARKMEKKPMIIFASTNKVYGEIDTKLPVSEEQQLNFCTPYGCSKGSAEQYILDYGRIYDIPTVVLRMSCIYGTRQFGIEEQGWLSHFMLSILRDQQITIYGDGTQVRDVLFIDDYVRLLKILIENKDKVRGNAFNIGGGVANTISIGKAIDKISEDLAIGVSLNYKDWRPNDQHTYISDISKIKRFVGWQPEISVDEGLKRLKEWSLEVVKNDSQD